MSDVTECSVADLHAAWKRQELIVDVRESDEFAEGHVPTAISVPLAELPARLGEFPADKTVFVVCRSGRRSLTGAEALSAAGIRAVSVRGGTLGWVSAGHPVLTRPQGD